MSVAFADAVASATGVLYPAGPGSDADFLRSMFCASTCDRARALLREAGAAADGDDVRLLAAIGSALDTAEQDELLRLFGHPLANLDAPPRDCEEDGDRRPLVQRAKAIARHLVGHPDSPTWTCVFDRSMLADGLFLPHLGITLTAPGNGLMAAAQEPGRITFTWSDGEALTLPCNGQLPAHFRHARACVAPRVGPFQVLNGVPEVCRAFEHFDPVSGAELAHAMAALAAGLQRLDAVWPAAAGALMRHVSAVLLLRRRECERSHSPSNLNGSVLLTAGRPDMVGDLLVHEASHIRLQWWRTFDPVYVPRNEGAADARFDSPWRPDPRPLQGLVLGIHAFLNVCEWYRRLADYDDGTAPQALAVRDRQAGNVRCAFRTLDAAAVPSGLARELDAQIRAAVTGLEGAGTRNACVTEAERS